jgi:hypothetical protein
MSRFNSYAKELERLTREAAGKLKEAEAKEAAAAKRLKEYPAIGGRDSRYNLERTKREIEYTEAKEEAKKLRETLPAELLKDLNVIRKNLQIAVDNYYAVDTSRLSPELLQLLNSDILNVKDISKLMRAAESEGNTTAIRLISDKAAKMSKEAKTTADKAALMSIADRVNNYTSDNYLTSFDSLVSVAERTMSNTRLLDYWDTTLGIDKVIESF